LIELIRLMKTRVMEWSWNLIHKLNYFSDSMKDSLLVIYFTVKVSVSSVIN